MLHQLQAVSKGPGLGPRLTLRNGEEDSIGVTEKIDFVLAFYVVHEIPDQRGFFREIGSILKPNGRLLIVEPPRRVSKQDFARTIASAGDAGLSLIERPKVFLSKAALLAKAAQS